MDSIQRGISFCIELKDALTNKVIESGDIRLYVNGCSCKICKEKKYYIFEKLQTDWIEVDIISQFYVRRKCEVTVNRNETEKVPVSFPGGNIRNVFAVPFISIVLYPNERYCLPDGYERKLLEGRPLEEIRVKKDVNNAFSLIEDYQGENILSILLPQEKNVEGAWFRIESRDGEEYEDFIVLERKDAVQYVIDRILQKKYVKGSRIYELYSTITDTEGKGIVIVKSK